MTQESIIRCLQNGPLTSYQLEDLTGIPRLSIAACCTKMSYKKKLKIGKIKDNLELETNPHFSPIQHQLVILHARQRIDREMGEE